MSLFYQEVLEQPKAIKDTIHGNTDVELSLDSTKPILFSGMGSSLAACQLAALYMNRYGGMAQAVDSSELLHYQMEMLDHYNVFLSSQSGESIETKEVANKHKRAKAFTNSPGSSIANAASETYFTKATPEEAIASSKSFTTMVSLLLYLSSKKFGEPLEEEILQAANVIEEVLESRFEEIGELISKTIDPNQPLLLIGRGPSVITAEQGGLTLKETARIFSESLSSAQFRHGPFELLKEPFQCFLFNPFGETYELNIEMAKEIARLGGKVIYVSDEPLVAENIESIQLNSIDEFVSPIIYSCVVQIAAIMLCEKKGLVAGEASLISKVTGKQ
ncbi:SIS domain-containing protein [Planococcus sp. N028]|uniref:Glutamine--fructose-6-phosphate aminotransferase [isomerizing] n=1 Tax=Planococcus shixiaomingii TaxID=3058393 RepID=A0ABT8N4D1_9BACL|nr:SIS domain-containing protein [Planococcus sp. N028]MDN7242744.1 SIS domain-containing protein [Planococcus sp. N028]